MDKIQEILNTEQDPAKRQFVVLACEKFAKLMKTTLSEILPDSEEDDIISEAECLMTELEIGNPISSAKLLVNSKIIKQLKKVGRDDSEYCIACTKYLFTDMPDDDDQIICDDCYNWWCDSCAEKYHIEGNSDGLTDNCIMCAVLAENNKMKE